MTKKERPHAEVIKAWAEDADAVVEYRNRMTGSEWTKLQDRPTWREDCEYRIRPAPKKKVEMWQYAWLPSASKQWREADLFYKSDAEARRDLGSKVIRLDHTRIEVEED